ncbi:hypothetical protein EDB19DRAFT_1828517 [Suillus lakei]|nr:hypothetical protein EDB19DRAFT_1828517 [Suillus lakei]
MTHSGFATTPYLPPCYPIGRPHQAGRLSKIRGVRLGGSTWHPTVAPDTLLFGAISIYLVLLARCHTVTDVFSIAASFRQMPQDKGPLILFNRRLLATFAETLSCRLLSILRPLSISPARLHWPACGLGTPAHVNPTLSSHRMLGTRDEGGIGGRWHPHRDLVEAWDVEREPFGSRSIAPSVPAGSGCGVVTKSASPAPRAEVVSAKEKDYHYRDPGSGERWNRICTPVLPLPVELIVSLNREPHANEWD